MIESEDGYDGDGEPGRCGPCAKGGGLLLLAVGLGLSWIGADLLTGGALTRLVTGGGAAVIAASPAADDPDDPDDPDDAGDAAAPSGPWAVDETELASA